MGVRHGSNLRSGFKPGNVGNHIHSQGSVLDLGEPEPGDLVLVPVEIWLSSNTTLKPRLPVSIAMKFCTVDRNGNYAQAMSINRTINPIIELFCIEDLEGFLSLTEKDYDESMGQTKVWDVKNKYPGLHRYDYILKPRSGSYFERDDIDLFLVAWEELDSLSVIPGIKQSKMRKSWFAMDIQSQNLYKSLESINVPISSEIDVPVVGTIGTLLEKKLVLHSFDLHGNLIVGADTKSWFYKIILRGRRPMWFQGPIWKCPDELVLPIYLPIP